MVGVKIYQWTEVASELSGDGWRRRNHEWLQLPARPLVALIFEGVPCNHLEILISALVSRVDG